MPKSLSSRCVGPSPDPPLGVRVMSVIDRIKHEPALLLGALGTVLVALYEAYLAGGTTWQALVPVAIGAATRFFVVPASEVEDVEVASPEELVELLAALGKEKPNGA